MINNVSFAGRETLLTSNLEKAVKPQVIKASTYIEETVAPKVVKTVDETLNSLYESPCKPIEQSIKDTAGQVLDYFG